MTEFRVSIVVDTNEVRIDTPYAFTTIPIDHASFEWLLTASMGDVIKWIKNYQEARLNEATGAS